MLKLFKLRHSVDFISDHTRSMIVAAESADAARFIYPREGIRWRDGEWRLKDNRVVNYMGDAFWAEWPCPALVKVEEIGQAATHVRAGVVLRDDYRD